MTRKLASKLKKLRREHSLTIPDVAEKLNTKPMTVFRWERTKEYPDRDNLVNLAKIYGLPEDEFTSIVDEEIAYSNSSWASFPYPTIITVLYGAYGFYTQNWHPTWLILFTVPFYRKLGEHLIRKGRQ